MISSYQEDDEAHEEEEEISSSAPHDIFCPPSLFKAAVSLDGAAVDQEVERVVS